MAVIFETTLETEPKLLIGWLPGSSEIVGQKHIYQPSSLASSWGNKNYIVTMGADLWLKAGESLPLFNGQALITGGDDNSPTFVDDVIRFEIFHKHPTRISVKAYCIDYSSVHTTLKSIWDEMLDKFDEVPQNKRDSARSGGVDLTADQASIGGDVVGRDNVQAGGHIIHAEAGARVIIDGREYYEESKVNDERSGNRVDGAVVGRDNLQADLAEARWRRYYSLRSPKPLWVVDNAIDSHVDGKKSVHSERVQRTQYRFIYTLHIHLSSVPDWLLRYQPEYLDHTGGFLIGRIEISASDNGKSTEIEILRPDIYRPGGVGRSEFEYAREFVSTMSGTQLDGIAYLLAEGGYLTRPQAEAIIKSVRGHEDPAVLTEVLNGLEKLYEPMVTDKVPDSQSAWELISDEGWDRRVLELWWQGHTCKEIEQQTHVAGEHRIRNRLSELRKQYGNEIVPTNKQRRKRKL